MNELWTFIDGAVNRTVVPITLAVALLWMLERCVVRLTPNHRCWLWRLLYLKCAVAFFLPLGLPLPGLLESTWTWTPSLATTADLTSAADPPVVLSPTFADPTIGVDVGASSPGSTVPDTITATVFDTRSPATGMPIDGSTWLLLLWTLGIAVHVALLVHHHGVLSTRLRRGNRGVVPESLRCLYDQVARQMQIRRPPRLRLNDRFASPALVWQGRSQIVLPTDFERRHGRDACRLAMAHELAHYRRHDLAWNALVSTVSIGLFFFPPLWLARRRYRLAMESACDWDAIRCGGLSSAIYARLLVALTGNPPRASLSLGVVSMSGSESFRSLAERLTVMKRFHLLSRSAMVLRTLVTLLTLCVLAPWSGAQDRYKADRYAADKPQPKPNASQSSSASVSSSSAAFSGPGGRVFSNSQMSANAIGNALSSGSTAARATAQGPRNFQESSSSAVGTARSNPAFRFTPDRYGNATPLGNPNQLLANSNRAASSSITRNGIQLTRSIEATDNETVTELKVVDKKKEYSIRESNHGPIEVRLRDQRKVGGEDADKVYTAATREELKRAEPDLVRTIQRYEKLAGNLQVSVDADTGLASSRASSQDLALPAGPGANPAQQMMRDQLQQMLDQNADNPQLQGMLRQMLQDVENQTP